MASDDYLALIDQAQVLRAQTLAIWHSLLFPIVRLAADCAALSDATVVQQWTPIKRKWDRSMACYKKAKQCLAQANATELAVVTSSPEVEDGGVHIIAWVEGAVDILNEKLAQRAAAVEQRFAELVTEPLRDLFSFISFAVR